jgi:hypothetical protein
MSQCCLGPNMPQHCSQTGSLTRTASHLPFQRCCAIGASWLEFVDLQAGSDFMSICSWSSSNDRRASGSRRSGGGLLDRHGRAHSDQERRSSHWRGPLLSQPPVCSGENGNTALQKNFSYAKLCYVRNGPGLAVDAKTADARLAEACARIDEDGSHVNPVSRTPAPHLPRPD